MKRTKVMLFTYLLILMAGSSYEVFSANSGTADVIIFSFNRPMQLCALLESITYYISGIEKNTVIYRASDERFEKSYRILEQQYKTTQFIKQGSQPHNDFKRLTMHALNSGKSPYVIFAVDDIIVKNRVDLHFCINIMEQTDAYGCYLRLGTHLTKCYMTNQEQPLPQLISVADQIYTWQLKSAAGDWGYPNNLDMTLYRKKDVIADLQSINFETPNSLEGLWHAKNGINCNRKGLCFENSIVVNIPLNKVNISGNPSMNSWTPDELLLFFENDYRIDISTLSGIKNQSCHIDYDIQFHHS